MAESPEYNPGGGISDIAVIQHAMDPMRLREVRDLYENPVDAAFFAESIRNLQELAKAEREIQERLERRLIELALQTSDSKHLENILSNEVRRWLSAFDDVRGNMRDSGYLLQFGSRAEKDMVERVIERAAYEREDREQRAEQAKYSAAALMVEKHLRSTGSDRVDPRKLNTEGPIKEAFAVLSEGICGNQNWESRESTGWFEIQVIPEQDGIQGEGIRIVEFVTDSTGKRRVNDMRELR